MNKKMVFGFIFFGVGFFGLLVVGAALRQGWFMSHERFVVKYKNGEGVYVGTPVSIAGLKAGQVSRVELDEQNRVAVEIRVQSRYAKKLRQDARASLGRPFIIGERLISITPGTPGLAELKPGSEIQGEEVLELTDLLSGGRMAPYFDTFTKLLDQLKVVIEGDGTAEAVPLTELYKQAYKTLKSVDSVGREMTVIRTGLITNPDTQKILRDVARGSQSLPGLFAGAEQTLPSLQKVTVDLAKMMPEMQKALSEMSFTLQAMQRSFILSGGVDKLKKEQEKARLPSSENR